MNESVIAVAAGGGGEFRLTDGTGEEEREEVCTLRRRRRAPAGQRLNVSAFPKREMSCTRRAADRVVGVCVPA